MSEVSQKSKWLIEWEASDSLRSFANWMIEKAEALEAKLKSTERHNKELESRLRKVDAAIYGAFPEQIAAQEEQNGD